MKFFPWAEKREICTCFSVSCVSLYFQNAAKGLIDRRQNDQRKISQGRLVPRSAGFENSKEKLSEQKENFDPRKHMDTFPKCSPSGGDGSRMSLNSYMNVCENELGKSFLKKAKENDVPLRTHLPTSGNIDSKLKIPVQGMRDHKVSFKPEFKLCGLRPPLLRAVSWDSLEPGQKDKTTLKLPSEEDKSFVVGNKSSNQLKAFKDLQIQVQPVRMQKLTKLREVSPSHQSYPVLNLFFYFTKLLICLALFLSLQETYSNIMGNSFRKINTELYHVFTLQL